MARSDFQQVTLFRPDRECPPEVMDEVRELWSRNEFGNDFYYYHWTYEVDAQDYPVINAYLQEHDLSSCLIHWSW